MSSLNAPERAGEGPLRPDGPEDRPALCAENVLRTFLDGSRELKILKDCSLSVRAGEVVALVGRSGSGKSTLLHLLGLLDRPGGGEIRLLGTPTSNLSNGALAHLRNLTIGFVFQHYFLIHEFNVLENVLMPLQVTYSPWRWLRQEKKKAVRMAEELLDRVGLAQQTRQFPRTLSGGERQRVAIARALLAHPKILLCDEPTGNLDPETGAKVMNLIFGLCRQERIAAIVVTHDRVWAEKAGRILRLEDGRLREGP